MAEPANVVYYDGVSYKLQNEMLPSHNVPTGQFVWNKSSTRLFVDLFREEADNFRNPNTKKKEIWQKLVSVMTKEGYIVTEEILSRKLRNMKGTFKSILNGERKTVGNRPRSWEYYEIFFEIFKDDVQNLMTERIVKGSHMLSNDETALHASIDDVEFPRHNEDERSGRPSQNSSAIVEQLKILNRKMSEANDIQRERNEIFRNMLQVLASK